MIMYEGKLFITDYASYNDGSQFQFGKWWDLDEYADAEDLFEAIQEYFEEADKKSPLPSPREEIMFTDYEGFPSQFYGESMSQEEIQKIYDFIEGAEDSCYDEEVIESYLNIVDGFDEDFFDNLSDAYQGEFESYEDYGWYCYENGLMGDVPEHIVHYINFEQVGREYAMDFHEEGNHYFDLR